jgi:hypothetical protein
LLIESPFSSTKRLDGLRSRWESGERDLSKDVAEGLIADDLFHFEQWTVKRI